MTLPKFYPIVDSAAWIARLLPLGVQLVQLRIKDMPHEALRREIRSARVLCAQAAAQLIVNDHWQLAIEEACDFVHLGQSDLDTADLTALRSAGVRLGISTHDHAELERALSAAPSYVALGPIYHTTIKPMPWQPQGLERVREWKRRVGTLPLVAIGGLTVARAPAVLAAGADSVAMISDLVSSHDLRARVRQWLFATRG